MLYVDGYVYIHFMVNNNVNKILNYFCIAGIFKKKKALNVKTLEVYFIDVEKK